LRAKVQASFDGCGGKDVSMDEHVLPSEADAVFEGGGVKGIALVGALSAAEEAGVERWKNVAGTSAGAIVACLVAVGYTAERLHEIMAPLRYADYGWPGKIRGLLWNQFRMRGLAPGAFFKRWLEERIAESPLAEEVEETELRFKHVVRTDLPAGLSDEEQRRARYRLQVIASDVTGGRMLVMPHDVAGYSLAKGDSPIEPDELLLADAVRMSMSYPYLFAPVTLWKDGKPHFVVDGGLLSNFPIWLFDAHSRPPARPTWGFRLHGGVNPDEQSPYRPISMPLWRIKLLQAMFEAATGAWDQRQLGAASGARTVSIPTGTVATTDFGLTRHQADELYERGRSRAQDFFTSDDTRRYLEAFAARQARANIPAG
jgi:NTE family protein